MQKRIFFFLGILIISILSYLYAEGLLLDIREFEYLTYKVNYEANIFYYEISVVEKESGYEVTVSTRFFVDKGEELTIDNIAQSTYAGIIIQFFNPAYEEFLKFIDIQNPSTLEMYGMKIEYEGRERVGKYWGEKFTLITGGQPQITWIINRELKMMLKIIIPQANISMELVDFKKR